MADATVSAGYLCALLDFSVAKGLSQQGLLASINLNASVLSNPDNRVPISSYQKLMRTSIELSGEPDLALQLGENADLTKVSVVGMMCYAAETMAESISLLNRFGYLVAELDMPVPNQRFLTEPVARSSQGKEIWLIDTRLNANAFPELTEETWARFVCEMNRGFPELQFAKEVHVTHSRPAHGDDYERILEVPVFFESDKNALLINGDWPNVRLQEANKYVLGILSEHAEKLMQSLLDSKSIRGQVESVLIPQLHKGECNMDEVAKGLGMSKPTLYRRLKAETVSFEVLLDELRHKMAVQYLKDEQVSVNETAYLVGFSHPSAFSRAFKRWTGSRPSREA